MYVLDQLDPGERDEVERMMSVFPEIRTELETIQFALEMYATSRGMEPHSRVKHKIKASIENLEKEKAMDLQDLPLISPFSDHTRWLAIVKDMIPKVVPSDEPFMKVLQQSEKGFQALIVSSTDIGDEVHEDVHESFLILKGRCKCTVRKDVRFMEEGEFMAIPLHEHHDVEILSDHVVAILQRVPILA